MTDTTVAADKIIRGSFDLSCSSTATIVSALGYRWRKRPIDLSRCRTGGGGDVAQPSQQPIERLSIALDRRLLVLRQRDLCQHALQASLGLQQLGGAAVLGP